MDLFDILINMKRAIMENVQASIPAMKQATSWDYRTTSSEYVYLNVYKGDSRPRHLV